MRRAYAAGVTAGLAVLALAGCGGSPATAPAQAQSTLGSPTTGPASPTSPTTTGPTERPRRTPSARPTKSPTTEPPAPGTVPPSWLGTRPLPRTAAGFGEIEPTPRALRDRRFTLPDRLPELPGSGFGYRATTVPAAVLARSTWAPGCPVAAGDLRWLRLTFWGFDDRRHTGELLVNKAAVTPLVSAFRQLYADRFPIEEMRINTKAEQTAAPTGDGNDTAAFNCRPVRGQTSWSQHAYGLAVDVDPFQNPYHKGDLVLPELASAYLDRADVRPGMILPGGPVVRAFAAAGWGWGGSWHGLQDLQHFSANGR